MIAPAAAIITTMRNKKDEIMESLPNFQYMERIERPSESIEVGPNEEQYGFPLSGGNSDLTTITDRN